MITNYLAPTAFTVVIERLPNIEFFTQKVNIPSLATGSIGTLTPLNTVYSPKTGIQYASMDFTFIVDEYMENYREIYSWIEQNASPVNLSNYNQSEAVSDISIIVHNSHKNPTLKFTFIDCFPTDLGVVVLDSTIQDTYYPEVTATFTYTYFKIEKL